MRALITAIVFLTLVSCKNQSAATTGTNDKVTFNSELALELKKMAEVDQIAAYIPQGDYKKWSLEQWTSFKDSVFTTHQKRLEEIYKHHGFVGFDLAGKEGSNNFWLMVQHSDHNPQFQKEVLDQMKIAVENDNASPSNYGLLVDRVLLNTGEKQIYGTQVRYNMNTGQAYPKPLKDSTNVNARRKSLGLEPIEIYLNGMTEMHFNMNKENYLKKGILRATMYPVKVTK